MLGGGKVSLGYIGQNIMLQTKIWPLLKRLFRRSDPNPMFLLVSYQGSSIFTQIENVPDGFNILTRV